MSLGRVLLRRGVVDVASVADETLARLDASYADATLRGQSALVAKARALQKARPWVPAPAHAWPTLPFCTAAAAEVVLSLAPRRVWLDDDPDGLSVLLAGRAEVALAPGRLPLVAEWLAGSAVASALSGPADVVVVHLSTSDGVERRLLAAREVLAPGSRIVVLARALAEAGLRACLEDGSLILHSLAREAVLDLVPGGYAGDDAGVIAVVELRGTPSPTPLRVTAALPLDFDGAVPASAYRLREQLAALAPRDEASFRVLSSGARTRLVWYDAAGFGVSAELIPEGDKVTLLVAPYELELEFAARAAVALVCGGPHSRFRAHDLVRIAG